MKPIISEKDYKELGQILGNDKSHEAGLLKKLLRKLRIVKNGEVSNTTVRLNSLVFVWNSLLQKIVRFRIVLPNKADLKKRHISVLAPISQALLGYNERDTLLVAVPGVTKKLRIIKVRNS